VASDDDSDPLPRRVPLDRPRPLSSDERALLDRLVAQLAVPELTEQAATARVVGTCSCGCPSIAFEADGPLVPEDVVVAHEPVGRDDYMMVEAWGRNASRHTVFVTLHVVFGRLDEMEVWARWDGKTAPETDLPPADTLDFSQDFDEKE
jgi:hypothetical protein